MGSEYEVWVWRKWSEGDGRLKYCEYARCDNLDAALARMQAAKLEGYKCIKLEWRPRD